MHVRQEALNILSRLQANIGLPVLVRMHPNTRPDSFQWPVALKVAALTQSMEEFSRSISVAVCGNMQAQAKKLALDTPVVQMEGLDPLEFDHHGYVAAGIVFGLAKPEDWSFGEIRRFYAATDYRDSLQRLMGPAPEDRKPGLPELLSMSLRETILLRQNVLDRIPEHITVNNPSKRI